MFTCMALFLVAEVTGKEDEKDLTKAPILLLRSVGLLKFGLSGSRQEHVLSINQMILETSIQDLGAPARFAKLG